jgi:hypothetical protein
MFWLFFRNLHVISFLSRRLWVTGSGTLEAPLSQNPSMPTSYDKNISGTGMD